MAMLVSTDVPWPATNDLPSLRMKQFPPITQVILTVPAEKVSWLVYMATPAGLIPLCPGQDVVVLSCCVMPTWHEVLA